MFFEPMFFSICVKIILFDLIFWDLGSYVRRVVVAVSNMRWAHGCNSPEFQNYFLIQMPSNPSCLGFERLERGIACGCVSKMSWAQVCACLEFQNYFCNFIMCPPASLGFVCVCVCEREREGERERELRILKKENLEENSLWYLCNYGNHTTWHYY